MYIQVTEHSCHLFAGLSGGFVSTLVVHPLDLLKIRFAVNEGDVRVRPQQRNYWTAARAIVRSRGLLGLYQGVLPNLLGNTLAWGSYLYFYNRFKKLMSSHAVATDAPLSGVHFAASAVLAGRRSDSYTDESHLGGEDAAVSAVRGPRARVRRRSRRAQTDSPQSRLAGSLQVQWIERQGYLPGVVGTSHGALQFLTYELLKRRVGEYRRLAADSQLSSTDYLACSVVSKSVAMVATYPHQVVGSRLQDQHARYRGVGDVVRRTWLREGARGFYKGLLPSLLCVTPATCIIFGVYEYVSHSLNCRLK